MRKLAGCSVIGCPAVFEAPSGYIVVGRLAGADEFPDLRGQVGPDEQAVFISAEIFEQAIQNCGAAVRVDPPKWPVDTPIGQEITNIEDQQRPQSWRWPMRQAEDYAASRKPDAD